jgi:hypothetical protein
MVMGKRKRKPLLAGVAVAAAIATAVGLGSLFVAARPSSGPGGRGGSQLTSSSSKLALQRVATIEVSAEADSMFPDRYRWHNDLLGVAAPANASEGTLYVFRSDGLVRKFQSGRPSAEPFLDLRKLIRHERGTLVDLVFAPDYARTHRLYVQWLGLDGTTHLTELRSNGKRVPASSARDVYRLPWIVRFRMAIGPRGRLYLVSPGYSIFWINPKAAHPKFQVLARLDAANVGLMVGGGEVYVSAYDLTTTRFFRLPASSARPFYLAYSADDVSHPSARKPPGTQLLRPLYSSSVVDQPCGVGEELAFYTGSDMPELHGRMLVFSSCSQSRKGGGDAKADSQDEQVERRLSPRVSAYELIASGLGSPISLGELQLPAGANRGLQVWQDGRGELYVSDEVAGTVYRLTRASGS